MSVDTQQLEQAGEMLFDNVYVPAFLQQCEKRGAAITDQDTLVTALTNVSLLKRASAADASATNGIHKAANLALRGMFGEDVAAVEKAAAEASNVDAITQRLSLDEGVQNAAALLASLNQ